MTEEDILVGEEEGKWQPRSGLKQAEAKQVMLTMSSDGRVYDIETSVLRGHGMKYPV